METKERIRKEILQRRDALSLEEKMEKSDLITETFLRLEVWKQAKILLCYADFRSEVMTDKLILHGLLEGKQIYLPRVAGNTMEFYRIYTLEELQRGYRGIREPFDLESEKYTESEEISLCIAPGAVFDQQGGRIGYGKGYYDRYLFSHQIDYVAAAAFDLQIREKLPVQKEDYPMWAVITEKGVIYGKQNRRSDGSGFYTAK